MQVMLRSSLDAVNARARAMPYARLAQDVDLGEEAVKKTCSDLHVFKSGSKR